MIYDEVIVVIGIILCILFIFGIDYDKVLSYIDVIWDWKLVGSLVVVIGVGGIGFDVSEFLIYMFVEDE